MTLQSDRWLVIANGHFLLCDGQPWHASAPASSVADLPLGLFEGRVALLADQPDDAIALRSLMLGATEEIVEDIAPLARASQLEYWWSHHRFCGRCGAANQLHTAEFALHCPACDAFYYPRISPCIIVLVRDGERCLLAKHVRSRSDRYSTLAGFIEVGESAEQALEREVFEEVGLKVGNLQYITSQNWPFPSQLMLGYWADYESGQINPEVGEIADARWFSRDNLPELPPVGTISRHLIDTFFESLGASAP